MEKYVAALTLAIQKCFPDDIIQHIYQQVCRMSSPVPFEINVLWPAIYVHSANSVRILLKFGANVNHRMPDTGSTPIMYAAQNGLAEIVTTLLENGADMSLKSDLGYDVHFYAKTKNLNIATIIKDFQDKKEKEELINKNRALEQQCQTMDNKLNYMMGLLEKMNIEGLTDMSHKKCKNVENNDFTDAISRIDFINDIP